MSNYDPALGRKDEYSPTAAAVVFSHQASGGGEKERSRVLVVGKMTGRTPAPGWLGDEPGSEAARPRSLSVISHDSQAAATGNVPTPGRAGGRVKVLPFCIRYKRSISTAPKGYILTRQKGMNAEKTI